ncbi:hypothetical protein PGTUg99_007977 [Puccinia graminis f. sp. tritici]|uniref:hAT-like transposase RNase-H fold domain-containing protein n=1 Tax=Puccinia graminis f. sp. tritici TaxID=56615 RepID=A0A5B0RJH9_PUCGR|nr:hypothetical protein PGTUg99_007977 [Puccinia graminis f. sp. tritici]
MNNAVLVRDLKNLKWPRFKGDTHWIRCFAHILNLIVQSILRPFGTHKKKPTPQGQGTDDGGLDSGKDCSEDDHTEGQIRLLARWDKTSPEEYEYSSDGESEVEPAQEDHDTLSDADIDNASVEGDKDRYTSTSCKETLAKFRAIAKKLRYSPNSKAEFVETCRDKECATPHMVERDVRTRWNSTAAQLRSVIRCEAAILEWQRHKRHGMKRKYFVDQNDFDLARDLVEVLDLFHEITLQISTAGSTQISNVVVFIDQITDHLSTAIINPDYPPALRNACRSGLKITNKYYSLTDASPLYRIAILLHPSFRDEYFKLANWEPEWIAEAIRLAREMWITHYKPQSANTPTAAPKPGSKVSSLVVLQ